MWYYDKYCEDSALSTVLMSNMGGGPYDQVVGKGFIDKIPEIKASHSWEAVGQSWSQAFVHATKKAAVGAVQSGARAAANVVNHIEGDNADTETFLGDQAIMSNGALLKHYKGSDVEVSIPSFYIYFIKDSMKKPDVRNEVNKMVGNFMLLAEYDVGSTDTTAYPPNGFKYIMNYNDEVNVKGSFCLVNSNFILPNLLLSEINIEYSDTIICDGGGPLYAKVNFTFEYGRKPVPATIKRLMNGPSFNADSYIKINKTTKTFGLNSIINRNKLNTEVGG